MMGTSAGITPFSVLLTGSSSPFHQNRRQEAHRPLRVNTPG
jgi:hypothetical protein